MLSKISMFKFSLLIGLSCGVIACKPNVKVKAGVTKVISVTSNGCVAGLWATRTSPEMILKHAEKHINGEVKPSQINTELMVAVVRDQREIAATLLSTKIDINETNESGCTALIWAVALGRQDIAALLVDTGADVSQPDAMGKTPLMFAAKAGKLEIVRRLVDEGANVNAAQTGGINEIGTTPLHHAVVRKDNADVIGMLILSGANVDLVNEHGKTALMDAAGFGRLQNVEQLIEAGADIDRKSNRGKTARDYALMWKKSDITEYLDALD